MSSTIREKSIDSEENTCPVCFKDVEVFSIGVCDHPICHECSTRMRILCKEDACPICRQELVKVAFVKEAKPYNCLLFNSYAVHKSTKIYFETLDIQESYENLLCHMCYICVAKPSFPSLQALKDHLRKEHEMFFCDLCVENLKIFSHERRAYTRQELALHRRKGDPDNTSHRGHPLCNFCDQRYVDSDELFRHLRRDHYFCHFCDADGLNHYYCTYENLREHFREAHFLCEEGECKEEKFTCVFRTEIDIRAHKTQMHSQSLGKAGIKQARTLELEFTLPPRSSESKGRSGRRVGAKALVSHGPQNQSTAEQEQRVNFNFPAVTADIGNPEEFPSLSTGAGFASNSRVNSSDSMAQKLAKSHRFNIRNISGSQNRDEFPSLVAEVVPSTSQETYGKVSANRKMAHFLVNSEEGSKNNCMNGNPTARAARVCTSKKVVAQPGLDLRLENFPSLTSNLSQASEQPIKLSWNKKELKPKKNATQKSVDQFRANVPPPVEDYPQLATSRFPGDTGAWMTSKNKPFDSSKSKSTSPPDIGSSLEESKTRSKKNMNQPKPSDKSSSLAASSEVSKRTPELQLDYLGQNRNQTFLNSLTSKAKVELLSLNNTFEPTNCIGSKVSIVSSQETPKPVENNGAKPKIKMKNNNIDPSEFPALGSTAQSLKSVSDPSFDLVQQSRKVKRNTSTTDQHFSLDHKKNTSYSFLQPPDFNIRNQQLISTVTDLLCNQQKKIEKFRAISAQFRSGKLDSKGYYMSCLETMGEDCFTAVFPELVCLLPEIAKQQQLIKVHRSHMKMKGDTARAEPYVICATCGQVLTPSDLKHHLANHKLEIHFPYLGSAADNGTAWSKG